MLIKTYNNKIISNEPKYVIRNIFYQFLEENLVNTERTQNGRASPEKEDVI